MARPGARRSLLLAAVFCLIVAAATPAFAAEVVLTATAMKTPIFANNSTPLDKPVELPKPVPKVPAPKAAAVAAGKNRTVPAPPAKRPVVKSPFGLKDAERAQVPPVTFFFFSGDSPAPVPFLPGFPPASSLRSRGTGPQRGGDMVCPHCMHHGLPGRNRKLGKTNRWLLVPLPKVDTGRLRWGGENAPPHLPNTPPPRNAFVLSPGAAPASPVTFNLYETPPARTTRAGSVCCQAKHLL